jgi:hypothetical protein
MTGYTAIKKEEKVFGFIPKVRQVTRDLVELNFRQIKEEVRQLVADRLAYMQATPPWPASLSAKREVSPEKSSIPPLLYLVLQQY